MNFAFQAIGSIETCFKEKFGIPRQPGLVEHARGVIQLLPDPNLRTAVRGLEGFSHVWVMFVFHRHDAKNWKPSIRPPRLGGAKKMGVLASRSPHRPNAIGLSAVKLDRVDADASEGARLYVSGVDILDDSPVLDVKPYLPYADVVPGATSGWAEEPIVRQPIHFTTQALAAVAERAGAHPELYPLIEEMLALDPRPAFQKRKFPPGSPGAVGTRYGFRLYDYDVKWEISSGGFRVLDVVDFVPKRG